MQERNRHDSAKVANHGHSYGPRIGAIVIEPRTLFKDHDFYKGVAGREMSCTLRDHVAVHAKGHPKTRKGKQH